MSFMLAFFYMYDAARGEWERLRSAREAEAGAAAADPEAAAAAAAEAAAASAAEGVGHRNVPAGQGALLEEGANASHLPYGDLEREDLDAPKSVADRLADVEREALMRRFFVGVCGYMAVAALAFVLPQVRVW